MAEGIQLREALKVDGINLDTGKQQQKGDAVTPIEGDTRSIVVDGITVQERYEDRTTEEGGSDWYTQTELSNSIEVDKVILSGVNRSIKDTRADGSIVSWLRESFSFANPALIVGDSNLPLLLTGSSLNFAKGSITLQDRVLQPLTDQQITTNKLEFKVTRDDFFKSVKARLSTDKATKVRLVGYINALKRPEDLIYENVSTFDYNMGKGDIITFPNPEVILSEPTYGSTGAELWFTAYTEDELVYDGTLILGEFVPYFEESYYAVDEPVQITNESNVKTQYEANADTNAFTDADKTKLDGMPTHVCGAGGFNSSGNYVTVTSSGTFYKVIESFTNLVEVGFSWNDTLKRWDYTDTEERQVSIFATFSADHNDGSTRDITYKFKVNGLDIASQPSHMEVEQYDTANMALMVPAVTLNNGDYIELFVTMDSSGDKVYTKYMNLLIR